MKCINNIQLEITENLMSWEGGVLNIKTLNGLQIFSCFLRLNSKNIFFILFPIKKAIKTK